MNTCHAGEIEGVYKKIVLSAMFHDEASKSKPRCRRVEGERRTKASKDRWKEYLSRNGIKRRVKKCSLRDVLRRSLKTSVYTCRTRAEKRPRRARTGETSTCHVTETQDALKVPCTPKSFSDSFSHSTCNNDFGAATHDARRFQFRLGQLRVPSSSGFYGQLASDRRHKFNRT